MIHYATALKTEVFKTGAHDHSSENDRAVVFKKGIRDAMDNIIGGAKRIGAKNLRSELLDRFADRHSDVPTLKQVRGGCAASVRPHADHFLCFTGDGLY